MEKYNEIVIHLSDSIMRDLDKYIEYQKLKKLNFDGSYTYTSIEEFITGCVCHYLRSLKHQIDLSGIKDLGKPYRLQNRFKEYMNKKGVSQADLAKQTGILASNISLILKNKNQPSLDYFLRIWMALECPPLEKILYRVEE